MSTGSFRWNSTWRSFELLLIFEDYFFFPFSTCLTENERYAAPNILGKKQLGLIHIFSLFIQFFFSKRTVLQYLNSVLIGNASDLPSFVSHRQSL